MKRINLFFSVALIFILTSNAFARKTYFPISLGVCWGNIMTYNHDLHITEVYPNSYVSFVGNLAIMKYGKNIASAYVNYVNKVTENVMRNFLKDAKKLALKNHAYYYGVSNFKLHMVYLNNALLIVSSGDIVCGN